MIPRLAKFYRDSIYHRVSHIRGSHRLRKILTDAALRNVERTDEEAAESIFDYAWNNLFILDAARLDLFRQVTGRDESRISLGSCSRDFIKNTFSTGDYSDIVYISANPHFSPSMFREITGRHPQEVFFEVFHTYNTDWSEENGTVMPSSVTRDFRTSQKLFPDKKKIVHFMQPHYPFVQSSMSGSGIRPDLDHQKEESSIWEIAENTDMRRSDIWPDYKANLELVLQEIKDLDPREKTYITADHGNLVGEQGFFGHPCNRNELPLREVPMVELENLNYEET